MDKHAQDILDTYGRYHQNPLNKITHYVGIPLILFSTLGLLQYLGWGHVNAASASILLATVYYARALDFKIAALFLLLAATFYAGALFVSFYVSLGFFVFGWALQLMGHHYFEKKKPAFLENFEHLLIGPAWILRRMLTLMSAG